MPTPVDVQNFDSTTPGTTPTGWSLGSGHVVTNVGAAAKSGTNCLVSTTSANSVSYPTTQDSNTGKTSWSFSLKIAGTQAGGGSQYCVFQFRIVGTPATWATNTCYAVYMVFANTVATSQIYLVKRISGGESGIGGAVNVAYAGGTGLLWGTWYDITVTADESGSNTTIDVQIRRPNGDYLTSAGAWQSTQASVISAISNVSALKANSNVGMLMGMASGATGIYFDSSDYESLATSSTAWTKSVSDSYSITDDRVSSLGKNLADPIGWTDIKSASLARALVDTYLLSGAVSNGLRRYISDAYTISDTINAGGQASRTLSETLSFVDTRKVSVVKAVVDTLLLSDVRAISMKRFLQETYNLTAEEAGGVIVETLLVTLSYTAGRS